MAKLPAGSDRAQSRKAGARDRRAGGLAIAKAGPQRQLSFLSRSSTQPARQQDSKTARQQGSKAANSETARQQASKQAWAGLLELHEVKNALRLGELAKSSGEDWLATSVHKRKPELCSTVTDRGNRSGRRKKSRESIRGGGGTEETWSQVCETGPNLAEGSHRARRLSMRTSHSTHSANALPGNLPACLPTATVQQSVAAK
eukprot:CAMPEP_0171520390 /NCGR_PEP_ID=MMETSP0959-20130129/6481_1 /TAXON_ID=87120 /ORGANISM="Aurantiochytrium limacinum, Strain ATCCMYA-1381" /LENGTH=201 /DNA_ID=CAMNT_0012060037 /DNA_START=203 /DNA_END=809 /DNA_ORIENTATION=-